MPLETVSIDELERQVRVALRESNLAFLEVALEELERRQSHGLTGLIAECRTLLRRVPIYKQASFALDIVDRSGHKPTEEQTAAISLFQEGGSLKINAYAGAGKTSTLIMLANKSTDRGCYLAYNSAIVKEAKRKLPRNVDCYTMHSLARKHISPLMNGNEVKLNETATTFQVAEALKLQTLVFDDYLKLSRISFAFLVRETIKKFVQSGAMAIAAEHIPDFGKLKTIPLRAREAVVQTVVKKAEHLWKKMCDPGDSIPLGHDGYQKLWALKGARIEADFILLDEAQDTNEVVLELLKKQDAQLVFVGDRYQQIYEWRGAVNAMENIETDGSTSLTRSFRFGPEIADYASRVLQLLGEEESIQGNESLDSRIGDVEPDAILARTNGNAMAAVIDAIRSNHRPHLTGGNSELKALLNGAHAIQSGKEAYVPALFGFNSWGQIIEFSQSEEGVELRTFVNLVVKNGIPNMLEVIDSTVDEKNCDLVISTAHKAKGKEWRNVKLMSDFLLPPKNVDSSGERRKKRFDEGELRLFYVAITRAKMGLSVPMEMRSQIPLSGF